MKTYEELVKEAIKAAHEEAEAAKKETKPQFEEGQKYFGRSICDHECIFEAKVIKRTAKSVVIEMDGQTKRCKIHTEYSKCEYIYPCGKYSMCPIIDCTSKAA